MNDTPLPQEAPICKPSKWFLWRAIAMLVMVSVFGLLFLYDGLWGYKEKNLQYFLHDTYTRAGEIFQEMQKEGGLTEAKWKKFAEKARCAFPDGSQSILPKGTDLKMSWPKNLVNSFSLMDDKGGQNAAVELWKDYAASKKWDIDPGEHPKDEGKIREQFVAAAIAGLLVLITLFFLFRTMRRSIHADEEALYTQDGRKIRYSDMVRVDKRKWDTKGIALIYYKDGDVEKKAKIDGMVYGQFSEENGAPAEKLFAYVMERFKGEVIEYISPDEDLDDGAKELESKEES